MWYRVKMNNGEEYEVEANSREEDEELALLEAQAKIFVEDVEEEDN